MYMVLIMFLLDSVAIKQRRGVAGGTWSIVDKGYTQGYSSEYQTAVLENLTTGELTLEPHLWASERLASLPAL